jgi:hypothetical protein
MFAAFPIVLFIIGAILLVALPIGLSVLSYSAIAVAAL